MADPLDGPVVPNAAKSVLDKTPVGEADYRHVDETVRGLASLPSLTETILPSIKALLMPGENNHYTNLIDKSTGRNLASSQTRMMQRGMTGSDIEESAAVGIEGEGEMAKSNFFAQNAQQMAGFMKELATGDINSQRENLMMFAQLMGQKIQNDQDLAMFREQLQENIAQAGRNNKAQMWSAGISAVGSIAGAAGSAAIMASDERLKVGLEKIGHAGNVDIYKYRWSKRAQAMGAHDRVEVGILAQDVEREYPEAATELNGWKAIDYNRLPSRVSLEVYRLSGVHGG